MVASPKPPEEPQSERIDALLAERLDKALERFLRKAAGEPTSGGRPPPPPASEQKTIHNEITKLKANTLNASAIAFFVGGVIAPLVSAASQGLTLFQVVLGLFWLLLGFLLHFMAQRVLKGLMP